MPSDLANEKQDKFNKYTHTGNFIKQYEIVFKVGLSENLKHLYWPKYIDVS